MNRILLFAVLLLVGVAHPEPKPLQVYAIDVEGGQSTLIVSPSGQSLLIDTGWSGFNGRDADRIVVAAKAAGVTQLDYVLITHYHRDHVGGVPQLAERMKIGTFIDHGPNQEESDVTREDYAAYEKVVAGAQTSGRETWRAFTNQGNRCAGSHRCGRSHPQACTRSRAAEPELRKRA